MLLAVLAVALVPMLQTEARDGVFVGTLIASDPTRLVVRADGGDDVAFAVDPQSNVPAGFVRGIRVAVRFEVLSDGRYRATSVSPPRIPSEPGAVNTLPMPPEPALSPAPAPRADVGASGVRAASVDSEPASSDPPRENVARARRVPAASRSAALPSPAEVPVAGASALPPDGANAIPADRASPPGIPGGWWTVTAGLLAASILIGLAWRRD